MKEIYVNSEIAPLQRVLVHRPDSGISRVTPKRSDELLFDDIVHLPAMQAEHDTFVAVLKAFCGSDNVLEYADLIIEAIEANVSRTAKLIKDVVDYAELPKSTAEFLTSLSAKELTDILISGRHEATDRILFDPIPNFIFTRDLAITVNEYVVLAKAATEARSRENFIVKFVFESHPLFKELRDRKGIIDLNDVDAFPPGHRGQMVRVEGGDVMMLNQEYLLIGISERTNSYTADLIADALFARSAVKHVVKVVIPTDRAYMHLDTIFTQVDTDVYASYRPIIEDGESSRVEVRTDYGTRRTYASVQEFIIAEINPKATFVSAGGGDSPYQEREQWTDACNLVAIKPGVAVTYDRNTVTAEEFRKAGYKVVLAETLLADFAEEKISPAQVEKTIISLRSGELSRARGGGHCMTCPILRKTMA